MHAASLKQSKLEFFPNFIPCVHQTRPQVQCTVYTYTINNDNQKCMFMTTMTYLFDLMGVPKLALYFLIKQCFYFSFSYDKFSIYYAEGRKLYYSSIPNKSSLQVLSAFILNVVPLISNNSTYFYFVSMYKLCKYNNHIIY